MKLIFSDFDNTLHTGSNGITETLIEAIKLCNSRGVEFVICSGRATENLIEVAEELAKNGAILNYVSGYNGAQIYDLNKKELLYNEGLTFEEVREITQTLMENKIDYVLYKNDGIVTNALESSYLKKEEDLLGQKAVITNEIFASPKVLGLVEDHITTEDVEKTSMKLSGFTTSMSTPFFYEITKKGIHKGVGLKKMCEIINISIEDTFVFGDGGNDITLLQSCPNSVAVNNATDDLKKVAKHNLSLNASEDGASRFIIKYLMGEI